MVASSSSSLPYAAYQGHQRGQSSTSRILNDGDESKGSNGITNRGAESGFLHQPIISISHVHHPPPPPLRSLSFRSGGNGNRNAGDGPPPLRTISSLRSAAPLVTSSIPAANSKAREIGGESTTSSRTPSSVVPFPENKEAAALITPSTSSLSLNPSSSKINSHNKRHSYSSLPTSQASTHSRSVSSSVLASSIPHHISTAQRLRAVDTATSTNVSSNASSPNGTPRVQSPSLEAMTGFSTSTTNSLVIESETIGRRTAYRPGFQPRGTYRVRTDEFVAARERRGKGRSVASNNQQIINDDSKVHNELESQRLERRLEKLLALHYESTPVSINAFPSWLPQAIRKTRQLAEEEKRIREEELRIVKWEQDSDRKVCPLCGTPFSLSIRKHHCRLCGRIVCASPHLSLPSGFDGNTDESPQKVDVSTVEETKCSSLIIADSKGGTRIKDMPRWEDVSTFTNASVRSNQRGIRICKECRQTVMHRQYMLDDGSNPAYLQLYESLVTLQKEIEQSLPEFQEMILGLQKQDAAAALGTTVSEDVLSPSRIESSASSLAALKAKSKNTLALQRDAAQARKQLLANFANYDVIAKKIRNLDDQGNASLARVKLAIWAKANLFLQQNMFPLQSLPKLSSAARKERKDAKDTKADGRAIKVGQSDSQATMESLIVLEQQLKQVNEYAASAAKARKFQDAKSLKMSAQDLEVEIARLRRLGAS